MLSKEELIQKAMSGRLLLDGATGSNLRKAGMPARICTEKWILDHPQVLIDLQRRYRDAGSQILYAPTFQAHPMGLQRVGLEKECEEVNKSLLALSRQAAPDRLIAGDLTTMASFLETWDEENYDIMVENYRRQIRGLVDGGADLLVGETLLYPMEAEAILDAAQRENAGAVMITFTMRPDGTLYTGQGAEPVFRQLSELGAAAIGFNCVGACETTPHLVSLLRRYTKLPLICKPNAGIPATDENGESVYTLSADAFAEIMGKCAENGANILGGCCGTTPAYLAAISHLSGT